MNPKHGIENEFLKWLGFMDKVIERARDLDLGIGDEQKHSYFSPVRQFGTYDPYLRVKLYSNERKLKAKIIVDGDTVDSDFEIAEQVLLKGQKIRLIMELNPLWCVGDKFGYSWRASEVQLQSGQSSFRN